MVRVENENAREYTRSRSKGLGSFRGNAAHRLYMVIVLGSFSKRPDVDQIGGVSAAMFLGSRRS